MEPKSLLDTDVLSGLMRKTPAALNRARTYLADHRQLTISLVTRFEILRGLKAKRATAQLAAFDSFCRSNEVLPMTDHVIVRAADIYADCIARLFDFDQAPCQLVWQEPMFDKLRRPLVARSPFLSRFAAFGGEAGKERQLRRGRFSLPNCFTCQTSWQGSKSNSRNSRGQLIADADILIAATALENSLVMATNNLADFGRIAGLQIDNWLA